MTTEERAALRAVVVSAVNDAASPIANSARVERMLARELVFVAMIPELLDELARAGTERDVAMADAARSFVAAATANDLLEALAAERDRYRRDFAAMSDRAAELASKLSALELLVAFQDKERDE